MIGFDELTHFSWQQFVYMLSRNRSTCGVKPYIRATTNPDADSWVRKFIPLALGPIGFAGVYVKRGEVQAAKAAAGSQIPFSLSTVGICSIEEVAQNSTVPFWFQFYMFKDRHYSLDLLNRAQNANCPVLLLTVDLPVAGARYRYHRTGIM